MWGWPSFKERIYLPEQMDAPDCDPEKLRRTYSQLALINRTLSRMRTLLQRHVLADVRRTGGTATVVEIGCGGGDVLAWLARIAAREGLALRLVGIDSEPRAVARARERLAAYPNVEVWQGGLEALAALPSAPDFVFCNHVLHHIPPDALVPVLKAMQTRVRRRLLINDLERSGWAYALYTVLAGLAFFRSFTFADGRLSIRKGFRLPELQQACRDAGFPTGFEVQRLSPWRVVITAPSSLQREG